MAHSSSTLTIYPPLLLRLPLHTLQELFFGVRHLHSRHVEIHGVG